MVYCGKPSKGCAQCRAKRTKCDTKRPSCGQCIRAGRVCGGYRDLVDISFRDQTAQLAGKHQSKRSTSSHKDPPASNASSNLTTNSLIARPSDGEVYSSWGTDVIVASLLPSIESQATCYFFRNYTLEDFTYTNGYYQYVARIFCNEFVTAALSDVVVAIGLLGLGITRRDRQTIAAASSRYNSALRATNLSLRDEKEAKADQTLISVMLLGLFETNACFTPQSMTSWTKHINGAAAMLQLRGRNQLLNRIGYQLFQQLRTQIIVNCLNRTVRVPDFIVEWTAFAASFESDEEAVISGLARIVMKYCNLRASLSGLHDFTNPDITIAAALEIDDELNNWMLNCPAYFTYETVMMKERSPSVFSDYYHVYPSIWTATTWNSYRCIRILLNELLLKQIFYLNKRPFEDCVPPDETRGNLVYGKQLMRTRMLSSQLTQDICASVPFFLDYHKLQTPADTPHLPPRAAGGNLLLWPLFTAAVTEVASDVMRSWVSGRLEVIAEMMGVRQAKALAYVLSIRKKVMVWETSEGIKLPDEAVERL